MIFIPTSSNSFNSMLGGGFERGSLHGLFGLYGRGKTSICLDVAFNAAGAGLKVYFIDADGATGVRPRRLLQIMKARGWGEIKVEPAATARETLNRLDQALRVRLAQRGLTLDRAHNLDELTGKVLSAIKKDYDLIIVDSLTMFYREVIMANLASRDRLQINQQVISKVAIIMSNLHRYVVDNAATGIVTMQRASEVKKAFESTEEELRWWIGGETTGYEIDTMTELLKHEDDRYEARLVKNRNGPLGRCLFKIVDRGIADV